MKGPVAIPGLFDKRAHYLIDTGQQVTSGYLMSKIAKNRAPN